MDTDRAALLEAAVADTGALLVQLEKYRRGGAAEALALRHAALAIGDEARRLHLHQRLDAEASGRLLADAQALIVGLRSRLAAIRDAPEYHAAVRAYAQDDRPALARLLPAVFLGIEVVERPPDLHHALGWLRRGRPRRAEEVAADAADARESGLLPEGDDLSAGADATLPAVTLSAELPVAEPVVLRYPGAMLPAPVCRLADTGDYLVHRARLQAPLTVMLQRVLDDEALEEVAVDYASYRRELADALARHGLLVEER